MVTIEQHIWLPFLKVVSKTSARFPALNHLGQSEWVPSSIQVISILSVIHVHTLAKHFRQSELRYSRNARDCCSASLSLPSTRASCGLAISSFNSHCFKMCGSASPAIKW